MSNEICKKQFDGNSEVCFVKGENDEIWVVLEDIKRALPGIETTAAWVRVQSAAEWFSFKINGAVFTEFAIKETEFYGFALTHPRFTRFKEWVCEVIKSLRQHGVVVAPDIAEHPLMKMMQGLAETAAAAVRAEMTAKEAERIARSTEHRVSVAEQRVAVVEVKVESVEDKANMAWDVAKLATSYRERLLAIPELACRGWKIPDNLQGTVGMQMSAISRRYGDKPEEHKKMWGGLRINTYLPEIFPKWEAEFGVPHYSQYRKVK